MSNYFLEFYYLKNTLTCNLIQFMFNTNIINQNYFYGNSLNPFYGFLQEDYLSLNDIINNNVNQPKKNSIIAYGNLFTSDFNKGVNYYCIINRNKIFDGYIDYYLNNYIFYIAYTFYSPPIYFLNKSFYYTIDNQTFEIIIIYIHKIETNILPINYCWNIYKIIVDLNPFNQGTSYTYSDIITIYNKINITILQIFNNEYNNTNTNNINTKEIVTEALYKNFYCNYCYNFGLNYGLSSSFPSNNSFFDINTSNIEEQSLSDDNSIV
jgi:hypothetical protein